jgi:hypothetical protein
MVNCAPHGDEPASARRSLPSAPPAYSPGNTAMVAHGTTYVLLSPRNDAAETWGFDCTGRRWTNSAQRSPLTAADRPRRTSAGTPGPWTRSGLIPAGPRHSPGAPNPYDSDPAGTADAARPAIYRTGLCRARRSCLARGITGLEYPAGRRGLCEPCCGVRAYRCSGDGLTHSDQLRGACGVADWIAASDLPKVRPLYLGVTARWPP